MMWSLFFMSLIIVSNTQNLIRVGQTSQSSTHTDSSANYSSGRAVDGIWTTGSITSNSSNNWWSADLLSLYEIFNIMIYNIDQSNINIEGAQIVIGNSSEKSNTTGNVCKTITNFTLGQNNTFQCDGGSIWGRYVTIYLQTTLMLCEVQIYGIRKVVSNTQNLIRLRQTSQSSTYTDGSVTYSSGRAVDGNWTKCAITNTSENWWSADLLGLYEIFNIMIYNTDQSNTDLKGAQIVIGNSSEKSSTTGNVCKTITNFPLNQNNTFQCDNGSIWGRYVTIYLQTTLILCEVQIYGIRKDLILIPENRTWEDSLIYCRDHKMDLAYIHDNETQVWAELEVQNSTSPFVWLGLRYTCTLGFWFWVGDHPLQYENWDPEKPRDNECDMSVAMSKDNQYWYSMPDNETFNFMCIT